MFAAVFIPMWSQNIANRAGLRQHLFNYLKIMRDRAWIGIDFGTSGCRVCAIDQSGNLLAFQQQHFSAAPNQYPSPQQQTRYLFRTLQKLFLSLTDYVIDAIAVDATSGSIMLVDVTGQPLSEMLMYNDQRASEATPPITTDAAANLAISGLEKAVYLQKKSDFLKQYYLTHQADWLAIQLGAQPGITDYNNVLKSGFDVVKNHWPDKIIELMPSDALPRVVAPGSIIGEMPTTLIQQFGLKQLQPPLIKAGTTDSLAAFIATGASKPGEAVTSLGSTLVLKLICKRPVFDAERGIYSHKLGNRWLCGGASNSGGAVLRHYFNDAQLSTLSQQIDLQQSPPDYYPLLKPGERFPVCDPHYLPRLQPRPADDHQFLYGLLYGIARIETAGYEYLQQLSGTPLMSVRSVGGGSQNAVWTQLRHSLLQVEFIKVKHTEAAYGSALLARDGLKLFH